MLTLLRRPASLLAAAPLKKADDAIEIDTTSMTVQEVVERLVQEVQAGTKSVPE